MQKICLKQYNTLFRKAQILGLFYVPYAATLANCEACKADLHLFRSFSQETICMRITAILQAKPVLFIHNNIPAAWKVTSHRQSSTAYFG